jgi:hypothetical protein
VRERRKGDRMKDRRVGRRKTETEREVENMRKKLKIQIYK